MYKPEELFHMWYEEPLEAVKSLPGAKGGFVALSVSCFLYERYAVAILKKTGMKADRKNKIRQLASDFGIDEKVAECFWTIIRDGLLHAGMPMRQKNDAQNLPLWFFRQDLPYPIELIDYNGEPILRVQPFLFMDRVLELWRENPELLKNNDSFPWANIGPLPF